MADTPLQPNTFKSLIFKTVANMPIFAAYWGQRLLGATLALMGDALSQGAQAAFFARLPGHPKQAIDSLIQSGKDRSLIPFRGEGQDSLAARVRAAWDDFAQGGTDIQVLHVINQWGRSGWPNTWVDLVAPTNFVESTNPSVFTFTLTIPYGLIVPPWSPIAYGTGGRVYGESDFFYDIGPSTDIPMLLYLVKKWKPSRSKGFVQVFFLPAESVTFTV